MSELIRYDCPCGQPMQVRLLPAPRRRTRMVWYAWISGSYEELPDAKCPSCERDFSQLGEGETKARMMSGG
jgi:hypothetical protein